MNNTLNSSQPGLPLNLDSVLPLSSPLNNPAMLSDSCKEALVQFREALDSDTIRMSPLDIPGGIELATCDRFGLPFRTILCQRTGLIYTSPQLVEEDLPLYYERFYHRLHFAQPVAELIGLYNSQVGGEQGSKVWRHVEKHLTGNFSPLSVLEVGAGVGNVLFRFGECAREEGFDVDLAGTEFSSDCIQVAASRGMDLIAGGFQEAMALRRKFDVVLLSHVFEHMVDLDEALASLRLLLKPEGLLYVEVPGVLAVHRRLVYRFDWVSYVTHAHLHHFCLSSLNNVMRLGGFALLSGNEEVEAVFRMEERVGKGLTLDDAPELAAFLKGYLAMLALDRNWLSTSRDSPLMRIDKLSEDLHLARAQVSHYEASRQSLWWLFRQVVRKLMPWLVRWVENYAKK